MNFKHNILKTLLTGAERNPHILFSFGSHRNRNFRSLYSIYFSHADKNKFYKVAKAFQDWGFYRRRKRWGRILYQNFSCYICRTNIVLIVDWHNDNRVNRITWTFSDCNFLLLSRSRLDGCNLTNFSTPVSLTVRISDWDSVTGTLSSQFHWQSNS